MAIQTQLIEAKLVADTIFIKWRLFDDVASQELFLRNVGYLQEQGEALADFKARVKSIEQNFRNQLRKQFQAGTDVSGDFSDL